MGKKLLTALVVALLLGVPAADVIRNPAQEYLFLLIHGEDAQNKTNTYRIFTSNRDEEIGLSDRVSENPGTGGLKNFLENRYGLAGNVYAYQFSNPSAPVDVLAKELCTWFSAAQEDWKKSTGLSNPPQKFVLITHSAGGLVVRRFLTDYYSTTENGSVNLPYGEVELVITVNTPHEGTPYTQVLQVLQSRSLGAKAAQIGNEMLEEVKKEAGENGLNPKLAKVVSGIETIYEKGSAALGLYRDVEDMIDAVKGLQQELPRKLDLLQDQAQGIKAEVTLLSANAQSDGEGIINAVQSSIGRASRSFGPASLAGLTNLPAIKEYLGGIRLSLVVDHGGTETEMGPWLTWLAADLRRTLDDGGQEGRSFVEANRAVLEEWLAFDAAKQKLSECDPATSQELLSYLDAVRDSVLASFSVEVGGSEIRFADIINAYSHVAGMRAAGADLASELGSMTLPNLDGLSRTFEALKNKLPINEILAIRTRIEKLKNTKITKENALQTAGELLALKSDVDNLLAKLTTVKRDLSATANDAIAELRRQADALKSQAAALRNFRSLAPVAAFASNAKALQDDVAKFRQVNLTVKPPSLPFVPGGVNGQQVIRTLSEKLVLSFEKPEFVSLDLAPAYRMIGLLKLMEATSIRPGVELPSPPSNWEAGNPLATLTGQLAPIAALSDSLRKSGIGRILDIVDHSQELVRNGMSIVDDATRVVLLAQDIKNKAGNLLSSPGSSQTAGSSGSSQESAQSSGGAPMGLADAVSAIMMLGSLAKVYGPFENQASSSSAGSASVKKLVKKLGEKIWKEVMSGAVMQVAFTETVVDKAGPSPGDPLMQDMSDEKQNPEEATGDNSPPIPAVQTMLAQAMPDNVRCPPFAVVYTQGVLTPNMDQVSAMGWMSENPFSPAKLQARIKSEINKTVAELQERVQATIERKLDEAIGQLLDGIGDQLEDLKDLGVTNAPNISPDLFGLPQSEFLSQLATRPDLRSFLLTMMSKTNATVASVAGVDWEALKTALAGDPAKFRAYVSEIEMTGLDAPTGKFLQAYAKALQEKKDQPGKNLATLVETNLDIGNGIDLGTKPLENWQGALTGTLTALAPGLGRDIGGFLSMSPGDFTSALTSNPELLSGMRQMMATVDASVPKSLGLEQADLLAALSDPASLNRFIQQNPDKKEAIGGMLKNFTSMVNSSQQGIEAAITQKLAFVEQSVLALNGSALLDQLNNKADLRNALASMIPASESVFIANGVSAAALRSALSAGGDFSGFLASNADKADQIAQTLRNYGGTFTSIQGRISAALSKAGPGIDQLVTLNSQSFLQSVISTESTRNVLKEMARNVPKLDSVLPGISADQLTAALESRSTFEAFLNSHANQREQISGFLQGQVSIITSAQSGLAAKITGLIADVSMPQSKDLENVLAQIKIAIKKKDIVSAMALAQGIGAENVVKNVVAVAALQAASSKILKELGSVLGGIAGRVGDQIGDILADQVGELGDAAQEKLNDALGDYAKFVNPQMIMAVYSGVKAISNYEGMSIGCMLFSFFASPSLQLALYDNGDFIVPEKSARGDNVALFKAAAELEKYKLQVKDPLAPFIGVIAVAIALEIARHFADPGTAEALRIVKVVAVSGLSLAILLVKQEEIQEYFVQSHRETVRRLYKDKHGQNPLIENMFFRKPVVMIEEF